VGSQLLDERLRAHLARGELREAAVSLIRDQGPQILGYLEALVRSEGDAREVFAQFAEDLWRGLPGFRAEAPLRVWAWRLAWHAAARHLREPYRQRGRRLQTSEISGLAAGVRSRSSRGSRLDALAALRAELQPEEQTLLVLRLDKELSWREIALVLAESGGAPAEPALRKRFERIKERLARRARERGLL
jgi:RNA polymerase sigma-70 factor (ECF subfamily)